MNDDLRDLINNASGAEVYGIFMAHSQDYSLRRLELERNTGYVFMKVFDSIDAARESLFEVSPNLKNSPLNSLLKIDNVDDLKQEVMNYYGVLNSEAAKVEERENGYRFDFQTILNTNKLYLLKEDETYRVIHWVSDKNPPCLSPIVNKCQENGWKFYPMDSQEEYDNAIKKVIAEVTKYDPMQFADILRDTDQTKARFIAKTSPEVAGSIVKIIARQIDKLDLRKQEYDFIDYRDPEKDFKYGDYEIEFYESDRANLIDTLKICQETIQDEDKKTELSNLIDYVVNNRKENVDISEKEEQFSSLMDRRNEIVKTILLNKQDLDNGIPPQREGKRSLASLLQELKAIDNELSKSDINIYKLRSYIDEDVVELKSNVCKDIVDKGEEKMRELFPKFHTFSPNKSAQEQYYKIKDEHVVPANIILCVLNHDFRLYNTKVDEICQETEKLLDDIVKQIENPKEKIYGVSILEEDKETMCDKHPEDVSLGATYLTDEQNYPGNTDDDIEKLFNSMRTDLDER